MSPRAHWPSVVHWTRNLLFSFALRLTRGCNSARSGPFQVDFPREKRNLFLKICLFQMYLECTVTTMASTDLMCWTMMKRFQNVVLVDETMHFLRWRLDTSFFIARRRPWIEETRGNWRFWPRLNNYRRSFCWTSQWQPPSHCACHVGSSDSHSFWLERSRNLHSKDLLLSSSFVLDQVDPSSGKWKLNLRLFPICILRVVGIFEKNAFPNPFGISRSVVNILSWWSEHHPVVGLNWHSLNSPIFPRVFPLLFERFSKCCAQVLGIASIVEKSNVLGVTLPLHVRFILPDIFRPMIRNQSSCESTVPFAFATEHHTCQCVLLRIPRLFLRHRLLCISGYFNHTKTSRLLWRTRANCLLLSSQCRSTLFRPPVTAFNQTQPCHTGPKKTAFGILCAARPAATSEDVGQRKTFFVVNQNGNTTLCVVSYKV